MSVLEQADVRANGARDTKLSTPIAARPMSASMLEFLAWVASGARTYAATMEIWQTSCPRNSVWEDALGDGLIECDSAAGGAMGENSVTLTPRGRALIGGD